MPLTFSEDLSTVEWPQLSALYLVAGLGTKLPEHLQMSFANSRYRWFVHDDDRLVAAGRALSDGVDCAYICDVAVLPEFQGRALGRQIMVRLIEQARDCRKIILYAVPGKEAFYEKLGFLRMTTAMARFADEQQAIERGFVVDRTTP